MTMSLISLALLAAAAPTQDAPTSRPSGVETEIDFAASGGLRNWQRDPTDESALYVQDRSLRWYRVEMSGPCLKFSGSSPTVLYTTGPGGRLDRFSQISSPRSPELVCGVESIKTSLPPLSIRSGE